MISLLKDGYLYQQILLWFLAALPFLVLTQLLPTVRAIIGGPVVTVIALIVGFFQLSRCGAFFPLAAPAVRCEEFRFFPQLLQGLILGVPLMLGIERVRAVFELCDLSSGGRFAAQHNLASTNLGSSEEWGLLDYPLQLAIVYLWLKCGAYQLLIAANMPPPTSTSSLEIVLSYALILKQSVLAAAPLFIFSFICEAVWGVINRVGQELSPGDLLGIKYLLSLFLILGSLVIGIGAGGMFE